MNFFELKTEKFVIRSAQKGWFVNDDFNLLSIPDFADADDTIIESSLIKTYRDNIQCIMNKLKNSFPDRAQLIQSAFEAHRQNNYNASIPLLLAQADGIGRDLLGVNYFSKKNRVPHTKGAIEKKLTKYLSVGIIKAVVEPLISGLALMLNSNEMKNKRTKDPNYSVLNRHEILHGVDKNYGNETNSLRAISQLSYLAMLKKILTP